MSSVTQRINEIKQPRGGYIPVKSLKVAHFEDNRQLYEHENVSPQYMGVVIDYLTRLLVTKDPVQAFDIPIVGSGYPHRNKEIIEDLLVQVMNKNLDVCILAAFKFVPFDVAYRIGANPNYVRVPVPDKETIHNVAVMAKRGQRYLETHGIKMTGFYLDGAYTKTIDCGDGDYLTNDAVLDFKVSFKKPNNHYTLQILIYYLMGMRSIHKEFRNMKKLALFYPRQNIEYSIDIKDIPHSVIDAVEKQVIGY